MSELQILSHVIKDPSSLAELQRAGIGADYFTGDQAKVWSFLCRMHENHGAVPSLDVVQARFKKFEPVATKKRDFPFLISDLRSRKKFRDYMTALDVAVRDVSDPNDVDAALSELQQRLSQIGMSGADAAMIDLFSKKARKRMLADLAERRRGGTIGIPTGLKRLDYVTGGLQKSRFIVSMARPGIGKAQPLDAKVLTPTGWKTMGSMVVGSRVVTPKGKVATVIAVHPQGKKKIFKVTFSDGASTEVTKNHLWLTESRNERRYGTPSVKTTDEIARTLRAGDGQHWNHYIPLVEPMDGPDEDLPIDPYVLGCLLGDGHVRERGGSIEVLLASADEELIDRVNELLPSGMFNRSGKSYNYRYKSPDRGIRSPLKWLGLTNQHSWDKKIPDRYMRSSAKTRLRLLQGLLDTDGTPCNQSADFTVVSEELARQVQNIVRSLGGVASLTTRQTYCDGKAGRLAYRVYLTLPEGVDYFLLGRKQSKITGGQKRGRAVRTIRSVEFVRKAEAKCITIDDEDQLYVTDDYIVTHNSWLNLLFASTAVRNGYKVGLFPLEMSLEETALRLYTVFSQAEFGPGKALKNLDLTSGRVTVKKCVRLLNLLEDKYAGQLFVADMGAMTDPYTVARIDAEQMVYGFDLIWIDYLTLLKAPGVGRDGQEDHTTIKALSNGCKRMAMAHRIPVGASAQVSREAIKGRHFLPRLEHLAYGDSIGQDADQVISLNRKGDYLYYSQVKSRIGPEIPKTRVLFDVDEGRIEEDENQEDVDEDE